MKSVEQKTHTTSGCWKIRVGGYSHPVVQDVNFLRSVFELLMKELAPYTGCELTLMSFVPNGSKSTGEGHIVMTFRDSSYVIARIGISFGACGSDGLPYRKQFDSEAWRSDRTDHFSSSIFVMNFDEAWLLACWVGEALELSDIRLRYGA